MSKQPNLRINNARKPKGHVKKVISYKSFNDTQSFIRELDETTHIFVLSVSLLDYDGFSEYFFILGGCAGCNPDEIKEIYHDYIKSAMTAQKYHDSPYWPKQNWDFVGIDGLTENNAEIRSGKNSGSTAGWELNDGTGWNKLNSGLYILEKKWGERLTPKHFPTSEESYAVDGFFRGPELLIPYFD